MKTFTQTFIYRENQKDGVWDYPQMLASSVFAPEYDLLYCLTISVWIYLENIISHQ